MGQQNVQAEEVYLQLSNLEVYSHMDGVCFNHLSHGLSLCIQHFYIY